MWRTLIVVLFSLASNKAGARYSDYSGVKMPQYGGGDYDPPRDSALAIPDSEDYQGRSPDAPASLDYKYEEEPKDKTIESSLQEVESEDSWQNPIIKQRRQMRLKNNDDYHTKDKHSSEEVAPKFKSSHRYVKQRPRLKNWKPDRDTRNSKYNREENEGVNDMENEEEFRRDKIEFRGDKNKNEEDNIKYDHRITTVRVIRRKPRRLASGFTQSRLSHRIDDEDDPIADTHLRENDEADEDFRLNIPLRQRQGVDNYRSSDDADLVVKLHKNKAKPGNYADYNDYYDMKRVQDLNNKLPTLLHRTKARVSATRTTSLLEDLLSGRRANVLETVTKRTTKASKLISRTTSSTTTRTTVLTSTTKTILTTSSSALTNTSKELSLAEKSRLSILKKAQRKESIKSGVTTKPPVLLQVTKKLPTVVMVEPPGSEAPWLRAREVSDDTPEHLEKVKRLMRRKLIANAKNIQDLTDNWDNMVCDYIDTSLLNNQGIMLSVNHHVFFITLLGIGETWTPSLASVAERELTALLSAHRRRKEASSLSSFPPATSPPILETFPASAVDPSVHNEWNAFIATNHAGQCALSLSIVFLALINHLQRYNQTF